ncbi:MAG: hypothetical protein ACD_33C00002G0036 [uncultured bacterium]|nr:MAG: hypothetical protein ACD_33C00002G0036 [uncultured bacterium]
MFKPIPGNSCFTVSLSQDFRDVNGYPVNITKIGDGRVEIEIYGTYVKVCPKWLSLISHFEIYLPESSFSKLLKVNFVQADVRIFNPTSSQLPIFSVPTIIKHDGKIFRVIPNHSRYAISSSGTLIEVDTKQEVKILFPGEDTKSRESSYPNVFIYDPDKSRYRYVYIHRLVGMAWIKNPADCFVLKPLLNHKDGNKLNFKASNLEWCSFQENSLHAYSSGLRNDNIHCKVRDFNTNKVYEFHSKSQAAEFMGISKQMLNNSNLYLRKGKLINDKYEFRVKDDAEPWFYDGKKKKVKHGRYLVEVVDKQDNKIQFHDTRDFIKHFGIWNISNIRNLIEVAKIKYPEHKFSFIDNYQLVPIQAHEIKTGKILETKTIVEMTDLTGVSKHKIRRALRSSNKWSYSGFVFRYKTEKSWESDIVNMDIQRAIPLEATNLITGEKIIYNSLRSAQKALNVDSRFLQKRLGKEEVVYNGWRFISLHDVM